MSQLPLSIESSFLIRDVASEYRPAKADEVLRNFLRVKLGGLEQKAFAVLMLDTQNRLMEYVELFRGTASQASVFPGGGGRGVSGAQCGGAGPGAQPTVRGC